MSNETYRERTLELETVKFALGHGYNPRPANETAIRHFSFVYFGTGSPDIEVSWFKGSENASVTVGNTTTDDKHALGLLKKFW
jgi:hypothetical protein